VPAPSADDAVYEAIDAGIETVVCISDFVPVHDPLRLVATLRHAGYFPSTYLNGHALMAVQCQG